MSRNTTIKRTVSLKPEVNERLERRALEENRNFSNMVETAALNYLNNPTNSSIR